MFASLSTEWMEGLFEQLVEQATYSYTPPVVEEKPLFLLVRKSVDRLGFLFAGLVVAFMENRTSILVRAIVGVRMLRGGLGCSDFVEAGERKRHPRKSYGGATATIHQGSKRLSQFDGALCGAHAIQKVFDEEIRKPLLIEYNRLSGVLDHLRSTAGDTQSMVDQSFTEVDFVQHIGNAESFSRYYDEELSAPLSSTFHRSSLFESHAQSTPVVD